MRPRRRGVPVRSWCVAASASAALLSSATPVPAQTAAAVRTAGDNLEVFLMTIGPGAEIYERFGHNAIWIHDTAAHRDLVYNFGEFDFSGPNFYRNFAFGVPQYWLAVDDLDGTLAYYQERQRSVTVQELRLTPAQRAEIANRLAVTVEPEHRIYTYNYYSANCSTRVRDLLDDVLGGALRRATQGRPADGTLRFHTLRSITNDVLLYVGIDAGLGPRVDEPLDEWGEMFLPTKVEQRVGELRVPGPGGRTLPLVVGKATLLDPQVYHVLPAPPHWGWAFTLIGLVAAVAILSGVVAGLRGLPGRVVATLWAVVSGLAGLVLLFLWLFTRHVTSAWNHNVLFLDPVALMLLAGCWRPGGRVVRPAAVAVAALAGFGTLVALVPAIGVQRNLDMAELFGLPTLALAWLAAAGWGGRGRPTTAPAGGRRPGEA